MGLADEQRFLARLLTDPGLRERFRADPERAAADSGLLPEAVRPVMGLPPEQVEGFGTSLVHKRAGAVAQLLPHTARVLGGQTFHAFFREHAAGFVPAGTKRHRDDAIAFARALRKRGEVAPPWAVDLAALEAAGLAMQDHRRRLVVARLRHRPADLVRAASGGGDPLRRATWLVAFRFRAEGPTRWFKLPLPVRPRNAPADR